MNILAIIGCTLGGGAIGGTAMLADGLRRRGLDDFGLGVLLGMFYGIIIGMAVGVVVGTVVFA